MGGFMTAWEYFFLFCFKGTVGFLIFILFELSTMNKRLHIVEAQVYKYEIARHHRMPFAVKPGLEVFLRRKLPSWRNGSMTPELKAVSLKCATRNS